MRVPVCLQHRSQGEKPRAVEQYEPTLSITTHLLSRMLRAAGETELAAKVPHPSSARRQRIYKMVD